MPRLDGETYFNNFTETGYEELSGWTPNFYRDIKEADAILRFAGATKDQMALSLEDWCANMFIDTMGEEALSRMEAFYYMSENSSRPTEERRRLLKAAQLGSGKIDRDRIRRIVESYTGITPTFEFLHKFNIIMTVPDEFSILVGDLYKTLKKNMPAHIDFALVLGIYVEFFYSETIEFPQIALGLKFEEPEAIKTVINLAGELEESEAVGQISIAHHTHDCHFLDGADTLNGTYSLDSIYRKEIVE